MPVRNIERRQGGYAGVTGFISDASDRIGKATSNAASSLSQGKIVAIVISIILIFVLLIGTTWYCCVRNARKKRVAARKEEANKARKRILVGPSTTAKADTTDSNIVYHTSTTHSDEDWSRQPLRVMENRDVESNGSRYFEVPFRN